MKFLKKQPSPLEELVRYVPTSERQYVVDFFLDTYIHYRRVHQPNLDIYHSTVKSLLDTEDMIDKVYYK